LLNLVVLDVPDHSGQLRSRLEKELRHRIQCSQSRCKEEQQQLLWPKSLSPSPEFSRAAPPPASPYFAASISLASAGLDYIQPRWRTRTRAPGDPPRRGLSYGRALGSLRASGDIRNTVAIILPFDLTSCTSLESTSNRYDPPPFYATRIRTPLSTM